MDIKGISVEVAKQGTERLVLGLTVEMADGREALASVDLSGNACGPAKWGATEAVRAINQVLSLGESLAVPLADYVKAHQRSRMAMAEQEERLAELLRPYWHVLHDHRWPQDGRMYRQHDDWDALEIRTDSVIFSVEENTHCQCHPEYETVRFELAFKWLGRPPGELAAALRDKDKARAAANAAEEAARLEQTAALYARLKTKFGGGDGTA